MKQTIDAWQVTIDCDENGVFQGLRYGQHFIGAEHIMERKPHQYEVGSMLNELARIVRGEP